MFESNAVSKNSLRGYFLARLGEAGSLKVPVPYCATGAALAFLEAVTIVIVAVGSDAIYGLATGIKPSSASQPLAAGLVGALLYCFLMQAQRLYRPSSILSRDRAAAALQIWFISVASVLALGFLAHVSGEYSRGAAICFFASGAIILPGLCILSRRVLSFLLANSLLAGRRKVVVFGEMTHMAAYGTAERLKRFGYNVVERVGMNPGDSASVADALQRLTSFVRSNSVDEIFLAFDGANHRSIQSIAQRLQELPIPVRLLFDRDIDRLLSAPVQDLGAAKAVKLQGGPLRPMSLCMKRSFDIVFASLGLVLLAPLLVLVAIAIRLDSPGPIIFQQRRAGFSGRIFHIYKFRSMTTLDDGKSVRQATRNDKRVTRIGKYIRRTSIDELPQLLNVLRGEMSIVGPRPHALSHDDQYTREISTYALRHHMKPGITGWAQVNGCRGETPALADMEMRIRYDIWYIKHWSMLLDFRAVTKTIWQFAFPKNVY